MSELSHSLKSLFHKKRSLPIIAGVGLVVTLLIIKLQPAMQHQVQDQLPTPVATVLIEEHEIRPSIVGYGSVKPDLTLQAKAEAAGRITYVHPDLKKGAVLPEGTLVIQIDDKDYKLALKQAEADLLAAQANLNEMHLTVENSERELTLANEKLAVREKELVRLTSLRKSGAVSQSTLDQEQQNMLAQLQEVQKLENLLITLPSEIEVLKAQIDISTSKVQQSERDLARTQIYLPFNGRISEVFVERDQYIAKGNDIFNVLGMDKIIVNAQFSIEQFGRFAAEFDKDKLSFIKTGEFPDFDKVLNDLGMDASIEIAGSQFQPWDAKVERFSDNLDFQSGTIGVIVSVSDSYRLVEPGVRPPLLEGMYMKVTLKGRAVPYLTLPRFALHDSQVFKVAEDNTLARIELPRLLLQGSLALTKTTTELELSAGDRIIVSDVFPAVSGMPVQAIDDSSVDQRLAHWVEAAK